MIKKKRVLAGVIIVAAVAAFILFFVITSEEDKIKRQFKHLSEIGSRQSGENPVFLASRVLHIKKLFAKECYINFPAHSISKNYTRQEIVSSTFNVLSRYDTLKSDFDDLIVFISDSTAQAVLTVKLTGTLLSGAYVEDIYEVDCMLMKNDGKWLFSRIEIADVLMGGR